MASLAYGQRSFYIINLIKRVSMDCWLRLYVRFLAIMERCFFIRSLFKQENDKNPFNLILIYCSMLCFPD